MSYAYVSASSSLELSSKDVDLLLDVVEEGGPSPGVDWFAPPPEIQDMLRDSAQPGSIIHSQGDAAFESPEGRLPAFKFVTDGQAFTESEAALLGDRLQALRRSERFAAIAADAAASRVVDRTPFIGPPHMRVRG